MIRITYPKMAIERAREISLWAERETHRQRDRDRLCHDIHGLTHRYLSRVGTIHKSPSNRTLMALGFELVLRDKKTGREEVIPLMVREA